MFRNETKNKAKHLNENENYEVGKERKEERKEAC